MPFNSFQDYIKDLCKSKKLNVDDFIEKLNDCKVTGVSSATVKIFLIKNVLTDGILNISVVRSVTEGTAHGRNR